MPCCPGHRRRRSSSPPQWLLATNYISVRTDERVKTSTILNGPSVTTTKIPAHKAQLLNNLKIASYVFKVCSYAQGLGITKGCSNDMRWNTNL